MQSDDLPSVCAAAGLNDPARLAEQLAVLAREARLLEFALDGSGDGARRLAGDLESALENAMDAESAIELMQASAAIEAVLGEILDQGMRLTAEMTEMEVDGVLGTSRMPVLTAVLSSSPRA
jgi:hypothetical protein